MPAPTIEPMPMNAAPRTLTCPPGSLALIAHPSLRTAEVHADGVMSPERRARIIVIDALEGRPMACDFSEG